MKTVAITLLAAITLAGPTLSVAGSNAADSSSKPSSYAPQPHSSHHVYGAPIQTPILGHSKASPHKYPANSPTTTPHHRAENTKRRIR
jgi:hypothetical protein